VDFGLSEDQTLFQQALRGWLAEQVPIERVRVLMEDERGRDPGLLAGLGAQGALGILTDPAHDGSGLGLLDAAIAAEEIGRAAAPVSFHSAAVMAPLALALAGSEEQRRRWLPAAARGEALLACADGAPAASGDTLKGRVLFVPDAGSADAFVLAAADGSLLLLPRDTPGLAVESLAAIDATRKIGELVLDGVCLDAVHRLAGATPPKVARILDAGRIALAADALGAAERALEVAVEYVGTRQQFGRVVGSFQAVKHLCAETIADLEPLRSLLWYAAFAWDTEREDANLVSALLKAHAGDVATRSVTTCVQLFGGMGFTWECDVHLWFKRAGYDRQMLGSPTALRAAARTLATS
jgi:alkylation response protein AidB-like acyl-CoA dehydrogenase